MVLALLVSCVTPGSTDLDAEPVPWVAPDNRWPSHTPPADLVGEGFELGQVVPDVRLLDQHGEEVALWQLYGEVVLVTISAVWCPPCRDLALDAELVIAEYDGQGVVLVTVLEEDAGGLTPEVTDAADWAATYGDHSPVLADPDAEFAPALNGGFPGILVLGRDLVVSSSLFGGTVDDLRQRIDAEL